LIIFLLLLLLGLIVVGLPVLLAVALVGFVGVAAEPDLVLALFPQKMFGQINSFTLLALPYFILAGSIMSQGGISQRLVDFARTLVGHLQAGLAHAAVVSSMVFAGVSGSSTADASAIGSIVIPTMKKSGYQPGFAAALIAVAGTIGSIIPPSMTMVVYGALAQVSIGGLFLAGIIPGILIGLFLMTAVKLHTYLPGYPELREVSGSFSPMAVLRAARRVWSALLAPVIIVGGILSGVFTATEAGVVACLYALVVSCFIYRTIGFRDVFHILIDAAITTAMVSGIIAVAGALGWLLAYLEFNQTALGLITAASDDKTIVMLTLAAVMLLLTMFVESLSVLLVFVPVAVQIGRHYGVDPFQMGLVMVMANQIGATTPPMAALLFVTTSIAHTTFDQTVRHVWPFIAAEVLVLVLVILFEPLASYIPNWVLG
jgi:tripartite ATP-independent transporter DctM subunit